MFQLEKFILHEFFFVVLYFWIRLCESCSYFVVPPQPQIGPTKEARKKKRLNGRHVAPPPHHTTKVRKSLYKTTQMVKVCICKSIVI